MKQHDREGPDLDIVLAGVVRKGFSERMAFGQALHNMKRGQPCAELGRDYQGRKNSMCKGPGRSKLVNSKNRERQCVCPLINSGGERASQKPMR